MKKSSAQAQKGVAEPLKRSALCIRAYLDAINKQHQRISTNCMSVQTDSDQIVSAWERASKQLLQDEKKLKRLHAAAIAHTCFMPPQLGNRWIEFLNELESEESKPIDS